MQPKQVFFATPTFTQSVAFEFCGAMERACAAVAQSGVQPVHIFWPGCQFIDVARNALVTQFLAEFPDAADLFFVDDDVGDFPDSKVMEFLARPEPVLCGVYRMKTDGDPKYAVRLKQNADGRMIERDGLFQATQIPAGFLRIKRPILEQLAAASSTYSFPKIDGGVMVLFNVFGEGPQNGEYVGEDAHFSERCLNSGIDLWVDPNIPFSHRGTHVWKGQLSQEIEKEVLKNPGVAPERIAA